VNKFWLIVGTVIAVILEIREIVHEPTEEEILADHQKYYENEGQ